MGRRAAWWDAALYGVCALTALGVWGYSATPIHREWAALAAPMYALGTLGALGLARLAPRPGPRLVLAVAVFAAVALSPLWVQVSRRAATDAGLHAQSEVIVTEEAARALLAARNPYAERFDGPLADRPPAQRRHFPYGPGMLAFGVPRALGVGLPLGDARLWFAGAAVAVAGWALAAWRGSLARKVLLVQVLGVLPTSALLLATGGHDLPVVALMLLAAVLLAEGRPGPAGVALGLAALTKQTAWVLVPFLLVAAATSQGREAGARFLANVALAALPATALFAAWDPPAFVEDTVLFPLGVGQNPSPAETLTIGRALVHLFPGLRPAITAALMAAVAAVALWLLLRRPRSVARGCLDAGVVAWLAVWLAPSSRVGYLIYPLNLLAWGLALGAVPVGALAVRRRSRVPADGGRGGPP
ncbi:MAG TPA: glycosyltransferase 87 family protein [Actinomycetota bacterium]|nr:glycosyltransferase 87 family protein [Actinomycetota bacterium]